MIVLLSDAWWNDPSWIGIFVSAIGIVIGIIFAIIFYYRKQRTRKEITYEIVSDAPIVDIDRRVKGKIKIIYDDQGNQHEIIDARLLILKVWNSGNTDVKVRDFQDTDGDRFEAPIEFQFEGRKVLNLTPDPSNVIEKKDLETYLNTPFPDPGSIGLPHCLLKPNQEIRISLLLDGPKGKIEQKGKLVDGTITEFDPIRQKTTRRRNLLLAIAALSLVVLVLFFSNGYLFYLFQNKPNNSAIVSPADTSPSSLSAIMTIDEDQTASDGKSSITLQFSSLDVGGTNFVDFSHGETVSCQNDSSGPLVFNSNKLGYATRVGPTGDYTCMYKQNNHSTPVLITVPRGAPLRPESFPSEHSKFTVTYNPNNDLRLRYCTVEVDAQDGTKTISSPPNLPDNGQYTIPNISGLSGPGSVIVTRTCKFITQTSTQFASLSVIYTSIAATLVHW